MDGRKGRIRERYFDSSKSAVIKIKCFFCGDEFEFSAQYGYLIERAYCSKKDCRSQYMKSSGNPKVYRGYTRYLKEVQKSNCDKGVTIDFYVKDGKLFRKCPSADLDLGKVVGRDENFVYAQKMALDSVLRYKRECVHEEGANK